MLFISYKNMGKGLGGWLVAYCCGLCFCLVFGRELVLGLVRWKKRIKNDS